MSSLVKLSEHFYSVCSRLADGIETTKGIVQYIAQTNYNIVATVISVISFIFEILWTIGEQGLLYLQRLINCFTDFFHSIGIAVDSVLSFVCMILFEMHSGIVRVYDNIASLNYFVVSCLSNSVFAVKTSILDIVNMVASVISWSAASFVSIVVAIYMFFASVGKFCVSVVTGAWHCLGFVFSSIAYFPVYCFECVESLKKQIVQNVVHAFTAMPKETYLVMICLCLCYFTLSNAVRYINSHGIRKLFSSRLRSPRMRRPSGVEWQFDRDFESDFEDLYGNDTNTGEVWMIPRTLGGEGSDEGDGNDASDNESNRSDGSDSDTVDDDDDDEGLTDDEDDDDDDTDDGRSEDGYTVISDDSDSDTSLNSHTLSTESSEHEIEVSLPDMDDRYSLRSRSSTPSSSFPKSFSSQEEFEREMEREKDKRKCVICQDQVKSVLIMPCRHMCMCVLCADQIVRSRNTGRRVCPLCRTKIQKVMNVYV